MKTLEEVYKFYQKELYADLVTIDSQRKGALTKIFYLGLVVIPIAGFLTWVTQHPISLAVGLFIIIGGAHIFSKEYTDNFKVSVIEKLINFLDERLDYSRTRYIGQHLYEQSGIFRQRIDKYSGDDYVSGILDKTKIEFSEIHAQYVTHDKNGSHDHTIFKGLFIIADFNKNFNGKTIILPDVTEKLFGTFGAFLQMKKTARGELVKLEDPEFEKHFAVYSSDQIEARYILSTSLMHRITEFKKKSNRKIYIAFSSSKIFVAISYVKNLFEPRLFSTIIDFAPIKEYYEDLTTAIRIVEDLNLNTRLWSKK